MDECSSNGLQQHENNNDTEFEKRKQFLAHYSNYINNEYHNFER